MPKDLVPKKELCRTQMVAAALDPDQDQSREVVREVPLVPNRARVPEAGQKPAADRSHVRGRGRAHDHQVVREKAVQGLGPEVAQGRIVARERADRARDRGQQVDRERVARVPSLGLEASLDPSQRDVDRDRVQDPRADLAAEVDLGAAQRGKILFYKHY